MTTDGFCQQAINTWHCPGSQSQPSINVLTQSQRSHYKHHLAELRSKLYWNVLASLSSVPCVPVLTSDHLSPHCPDVSSLCLPRVMSV